MRFDEFVEINPKVSLRRNISNACVMMEDIIPGNRYVRSTKQKEFKGGAAFETGDTLFARITPCLENGKIAQYIGVPAFGSTEYFVFRGIPGISDNNFVYYLCLTDEIRKPAEQSMFGASGRQRADITAIKRIHIFPPPLDIQSKIASILSAYDDLIENNTRRIRILEEMAQAIYREWFVHFRFPGHEGARMVESSLGPIPEGWEVSSLSEIARINPEQINRNNEPASINYIDITSVEKGKINHIEKMSFQLAPSRARRKVVHGDIIWSTVRPNRRSFALIYNPESNTVVSTGFAVIRCVTTPYSYLYFAVTTDEFTDYLANHASGAAYPAVNHGDFEKALLLCPRIDLIALFHQLIEPNLELIENLRVKNTNLRGQRDLLLPRLISGELDVEGLDISTGEENGRTHP